MARYSNSYINSFTQCPLRCRYKHDLHLRPADDATSEHHLTFGRAGHKAFESLYTEGDAAKAKEIFRHFYPVQIDPNDFAKTADNACFTIDMYVKTYDWDKQWKVLAIEEMDHTEDNYTVKLDLVVEDTRNGDILGVDHKFTGSYLDYKFFSKFNPNSQVTQYFRYIKEKYGHCDGFVINAVGMKYRQRAYKGESAGFWCAFERQVMNRTPQQIEQEQQSKDYWIERIEHAKQSGIWGMNTSQCFLCEYQAACAAGWDWEHDSELIKTLFKQVCDKWIPEQQSHCLLELGHEDDHDGSIKAMAQTMEFEVDV